MTIIMIITIKKNKDPQHTQLHSQSSITNHDLRKDRIMNIVNKAKNDAAYEFENELNRGNPMVSTRFHFEHIDITKVKFELNQNKTRIL